MPPRAKRHRKQAKATETGAHTANPPAELEGDHGKQNNFKIFLENLD